LVQARYPGSLGQYTPPAVEIIDSPLATTGSHGRHWVRFTLEVPLLFGI
jgi:hypothetical protein